MPRRTSDNMIDNLLRIPEQDKGKNIPQHRSVDTKNAVHQADLIYLPMDKGFKYALVVVDLATGLTDAEPVRDKKARDILKAFQKIYARDILTIPMKLEVDNGGEFKGETREYFQDEKVYIRTGQPDRHRQQSMVERRNRAIGTMLFKRQTAQEILTGEEDPRWVDELPDVIKEINLHQKFNKHTESTSSVASKLNMKPDPMKGSPVCKGDSCELLEVGTIVRRQLDAPISPATGKKLNGRFRATDVRWHPDPRKVERVLLAPNQPPMYLLDGKEHVAYTKNQLQVIPEKEKAPSRSVLRGKARNPNQKFRISPSD